MVTQSFQETKNFSCGEGGALLIIDKSLVERAEIIREKGTNHSRFFRGQVDKYTWVDLGSSFLPSDILATWLYAQLENRRSIQAKRQKIWENYHSHLQEWAAVNVIRLREIPASLEQSFHIDYMLLPSLETRQALIKFLRERNIERVFHYLPLHLSDMGCDSGEKMAIVLSRKGSATNCCDCHSTMPCRNRSRTWLSAICSNSGHPDKFSLAKGGPPPMLDPVEPGYEYKLAEDIIQ